VYRAADTRLDRTVAIKFLPDHIASDAELREGFERPVHGGETDMWSMLAAPQKSRPVVRVGALSTRVLFGTPLAQLKHYNLRPEVRMLHEFIAVNRDEIISRWRAKVSARSSLPPTEAEIDHGVPVFLGADVGAHLGAVCAAHVSALRSRAISSPDLASLRRA
jgi:hypothetical protein